MCFHYGAGVYFALTGLNTFFRLPTIIPRVDTLGLDITPFQGFIVRLYCGRTMVRPYIVGMVGL